MQGRERWSVCTEEEAKRRREDREETFCSLSLFIPLQTFLVFERANCRYDLSVFSFPCERDVSQWRESSSSSSKVQREREKRDSRPSSTSKHNEKEKHSRRSVCLSIYLSASSIKRFYRACCCCCRNEIIFLSLAFTQIHPHASRVRQRDVGPMVERKLVSLQESSLPSCLCVEHSPRHIIIHPLSLLISPGH